MSERSYRTFVVQSIVSECESVKSFYLMAEDGLPLDTYYPGQHLPLRLQLPDRNAPLSRYYTISNFGQDHYRLTVRREPPATDRASRTPALCSAFLHDHVRVNDKLQARPPAGNFWLDVNDIDPVVLVAGGIGITPIMSMLEALDQAGSDRDVFVFLAFRHGGHHIFRERVRDIAGRRRNLRLRVFYEHPRNQDSRGRDFQHTGTIHLQSLREQLPTLHLPYFLCAPPPMMDALTRALYDAGVEPSTVRTESFGGPRSGSAAPTRSTPVAPPAPSEPTITFARSATTVPWVPGSTSILQLAEESGVNINSGCQYGDCGTCMTTLREGKVKYPYPPGARIDPGCCLPCIAQPDGSIVLDV